MALGTTYFVAVCALDVITNVGAIDDLTTLARMLLVLPVIALDGIFILWVFTSLSRTLNQLQARRSGSKLELYRSACGACFPGFSCLLLHPDLHNAAFGIPCCCLYGCLS